MNIQTKATPFRSELLVSRFLFTPEMQHFLQRLLEQVDAVQKTYEEHPVTGSPEFKKIIEGWSSQFQGELRRINEYFLPFLDYQHVLIGKSNLTLIE